MDFKTIIGFGALAYFAYNKLSESLSSKLNAGLKDATDNYNAQFNELSSDLNTAVNNNKGYADSDLEISVEIKLSSIVDTLWCMAGWVTITNTSSTSKNISGVLVDWEYNGYRCNWVLWEKHNYTIKANSSVTIRLHSVNTELLFPYKQARKAIREALKQKSTYTKSIGCSIPITANVRILQTINGYSTDHLFTMEAVKGKCIYDSYGTCFSYNTNKNGSDLGEFYV
ncbi:MAG: hypothetical protein NC038_07790 [Paludibacter sp.]|nr:hypothetical protein [Prevotella sp.]MCM1443644.1 hypothetical protein [Muribaculum sp.]MCM1482519.1 hypothetical protein [Paludibacter sp.]MCM1576895.1 hypothetical protein [Bacteroides sp.]